ncbi:hypothetical protein HY522_00190 [bacterium]|nr:hypothetical protein [bacterium]
MEAENIRAEIQRRVAISGQIVILVVVGSLVLFGLILGVVYTDHYDSEKLFAAAQLRTFVIANTENFQTGNTAGIKKAAYHLIQAPAVSHLVIFDGAGRTILSMTSPEYAAGGDDGEKEIADLMMKIQGPDRLTAATSGSDLNTVKLQSGRSLLRAFIPIRRGAARLAEVEMGFFKSQIRNRALQRIRTPGAICAAGALIIMVVGYSVVSRWEKTKSRELAQLLDTQMEQQKIQYDRKIFIMKKENEGKDLEGGSFFNIMESVRDISGATDLDNFVRRTVLASVRLFRCRLVSLYLSAPKDVENSAWKLSGRYDGKGYAHDLEEVLDIAKHAQLRNALTMSATELLEDYPVEKNQSLLISVSSDKNRCALILFNKVGTFDTKDVMAGRIFAGFLPNLLAWHGR